MQKITPFLWFDNNAEEAINFYISIFEDSKVGELNRGPDGKVFTGSVVLNGQELLVLNGGPMYKFNESISFMVNCENQEEVDIYWNKLVEGGEEGKCGWLKDKFGLSWQVIPKQLGELLGDSDTQKSQRVMQAMLLMKKIEVLKLQDAYDGK
ncbi:MAG: VOC family protein [bacterium]|nr:VOC family protein [bacterium]